MVSLRKRKYAEGEDVPKAQDTLVPTTSSSPVVQPKPPSVLTELRNMWQFSALCQWLYIFGGLVKLDSMDINDLEAHCLNPHSTALQDIGLAMLKYLSSHRGLTHELFDEYTRRQYTAKAPHLVNPFGTDEVPAKFSEFTVFQKIRVLHQMTLFTMINAEKLRDKMAELKDAERDQTTWRIEPFGWDREDRAYFVLDDNRVYRLTEAEPEFPKPKKNTKKARAQARRGSKRRRVSVANPTEADESDGDSAAGGDETQPHTPSKEADDGLGGMRWECVATTLEDLQALLATIPGKKDPNERILHKKIVDHLLPILEQQNEKAKKLERERERELANLAKLATAKRSSRIASRHEQHRNEVLQREEELKRIRENEARKKDDDRQRKAEKERDNRLFSREKRLRERELRRAQHEGKLLQLSGDAQDIDGASGRMSERRRQAEIQKAQDALRKLDEEGDEEWRFDCVCGLHGQVDDGEHSVSCEKCNIWQHSKCLGIDEEEAEKDHFHFVCSSCKCKADALTDKSLPGQSHTNIKLGLMINRPSALDPPATKQNGENVVPIKTDSSAALLSMSKLSASNSLSGPARGPSPDSHAAPVGHAHPFSLGHPGLSQPDLSPRKSYAYGTIYEQQSPGLERQIEMRVRSPVQTPGPGPLSNPGSAQPQRAQLSPAVFATPRLQHGMCSTLATGSGSVETSPLLPSQGGLSPTKHSPTNNNNNVGGLVVTSPSPLVFPPTAALSPSAPQQILTPPVKPEGAAHRQSFSGLAPEVARPPSHGQ